MTSYEHKVKNIYLGSPYNEGTPLIPGDYTLLRGPCDEGFHVPLHAEIQQIRNLGIGSQVATTLHIPLSGLRRLNGTRTVGSTGYLWSVTPSGGYTYSYSITSSGRQIQDDTARAAGYPVRGFRNIPIIPDENRTETLTGKIWYNSDLGLISVLVGTNQYITLQDKNVGATVVYNSGDTLTDNNRGKYFQRGNNYGFTWEETGTISTTEVNTTGYGPSNPYSSNIWINPSSSNGNWSNVANQNLRGYTDFNS